MNAGKCLVVALSCCGLLLCACSKGAPPPSSCQNLPVGAADQGRAVQQALADRHFDVGPLDGTMNSQTVAALRAFQKEKSLPESGEADAKTLDALGFCAAAPVETKPARECVELPAYRCGQIQAVQQALTDQGYNPGSIDGEMGKKTHKALQQFQADKKLRKTGRIDAATQEALGFCVKPVDKPKKGSKSKGAKPAAVPAECRK